MRVYLIFFCLFVNSVWAGNRYALVIGNSNYQHTTRLENPNNDAIDIGVALKAHGFIVDTALNLDKANIDRQLRSFSQKLSDADWAVVYYAGHAIEVGGTNYLLPIDFRFSDESSIEIETVSLNTLMKVVSKANDYGLVVVDACRNNPFASTMKQNGATRSADRGLKPIEPSGNIQVAYAAKHGEVAQDGDGRNSPFTQAFLEALKKPNTEVAYFWGDIQERVLNLTNRQQRPFTYGSLGSRRLYFGEPPKANDSDVFVTLIHKVNSGDKAALEDLKKHPLFVSFLGIMGGSSDTNTLAQVFAQSQSDDPQQRALGEAMKIYLQGLDNDSSREQLRIMADKGNFFAALMLERIRIKLPEKPLTFTQQIAAKKHRGVVLALADLAKKNDLTAIAWTGNLYRDGLADIQKNIEIAIQYFLRAAEAGDAYSMNVLSLIYENDETKKNISAALKWRKKAIEAGDANAMTHMGLMYDKGTGVAKDEREAVHWYRKAAEAGEMDGMTNLGQMYESGRGVTKDEREAVHWYQKAAEAGNTRGMNNLGTMYANGTGVTKDEHEAVRWYQKAAEAGEMDGMTNLGQMYASGRGVAKDEREAARWYRKAADAGDGRGMNNLGVMYENGTGVAKDEREAVRWYQKAANTGRSSGMTNLGFMYFKGKGITKDEKVAVYWFQKAARLGNQTARKNLRNLGLTW